MNHDSESTPLLSPPTTRSPLPRFQLFILLWIQLAEPIASQVIYPFVNKLVSELPITGGDLIGRKPVILMGLFGLSLSMISFGISRTFWGLVISRCLAGLLNGNVGVIKSMMGELSDSTNTARAFALLPIVWASGAVIGPLLGGWLSNPYERYPSTFGRFEFWRTYPYALPCFVVAVYCITSWLLAFLFLDETVTKSRHSNRDNEVESSRRRLSSRSLDPEYLPLRQVLTRRVLVAVANYSLLAFLDISLRALQPLYYTTPIVLGGLGFDPSTVGLCLAGFSVVSGVWQLLVFPSLYDRLGTKRVFVLAVSTFVPMFALFPVMTVIAKESGVGPAIWLALCAQGLLYVIMDMGFSCAFVYVRAAAPSDRALGATNGIAQTSISVVRTIGPALSNSLFALSHQRNILGGGFVYAVFIAITIAALGVSTYLPKELWVKSSEGTSGGVEGDVEPTQ